ncbi:MAG: PBP1A family penicillin-binding protein [Rhodobacteraceae bacterium]|nr:PBP1A family penicillin-binding protein [Paracoccaceae bacterium]
MVKSRLTSPFFSRLRILELLVRSVQGVFGFLGTVFTLVTMSTIVCGLSLGGIFWVYGRDLPSHKFLAQYKPPTISRIYSAEGKIIDEFAKERRLFTPANEIPSLIKHAFISAEDKNFYNHPGYDLRGILSALVDAVQSRGKRIRGASTITQQVMKNFLLDGSRRAERKVKEIILATRIEGSLSKEQILELYLNEIFLGQNSYGVTAASQTYFNKTLDELAPNEAAFLAALPKAPSDYHPVREKKRLLERRNYVLKEMFQNDYLSREVYEYELTQPIKSVQGQDYTGFRSELPSRNYFTDEIRRQLSRAFGEEEFFTGGMTVRSTFDPFLQQRAALALQRGLEKYDRIQGVWRGTGKKIPFEILSDEKKWQESLASLKLPRDINLDGQWIPAAILGIENSELRIGIEGIKETAAGNWIPPSDITWIRKFLNSGKLVDVSGKFSDFLNLGDVVLVRKLNDPDGNFVRWSLRQVSEVQGAFMAMDVNNGRVIAMQGGFSYESSVFNRATQANRQPGSSFKPFVYASALDSGYSPATVVIDAPIEIDTPQGLWRPKNYNDKFYGPTPLRTGIEMSRNLMTIRLAREVGLDIIANYAEKFGVYDDMKEFLANSLGSQETTLYRMVAAYAMFANGGERVMPTLVDRIQDRYGKTIYKHDQRICLDCGIDHLSLGDVPTILTNRERVMDRTTAYQLTSMMEGVVSRGTAKRTVNLSVPTAGKTGTTNEAKDVWFLGFTSNIVAGCYIGHDIPRPMGKRSGGGSMCGPVFNEFMSTITKIYGGADFVIPEGGKFIKIDRYSGERLSDDAEGENVVSEFFRDGEEPKFGLTFDGGFAMGSNFTLIKPGESGLREIKTATGDTVLVAPKATLGTLSAGGLY